MITRITSKDNPALKHFRQLQVRKYRQRHGEFVLEGPVVIREALEQGTRMSMALCTDDFRETKEGRALIRQVEEEGVPLYCTEEGLFASAAGTQTPQGILAAARIPVWDRELLEEPGSCFLVLDRVQDPGNIGTMVRTAEAAGFRGIIAVKGTADLYSGKVSRAAVGGLLRLPVFYCDSGEALLEELKPLGKKILCKGNHDYWWNSISQVRAALPAGMTALQHNAADLGDAVVCATRGWMIPTKETPLSEQDEKICKREAERLRLALEDAAARAKGRPLIVMTHYPPLLAGETDTIFTKLLEAYGVHTAVYGHLHGAGIQSGFTGECRGVRYRLVSCDSIGFSPIKIFP